MEERKTPRVAKGEMTHNIIMENRKKLSVSGADDVESFNEDEIVLHTDMGTLIIKGSDMHINKLSVEVGEVIIEGEISVIEYDDRAKSKGGSLLGRMFR